MNGMEKASSRLRACLMKAKMTPEMSLRRTLMVDLMASLSDHSMSASISDSSSSHSPASSLSLLKKHTPQNVQSLHIFGMIWSRMWAKSSRISSLGFSRFFTPLCLGFCLGFFFAAKFMIS